MDERHSYVLDLYYHPLCSNPTPPPSLPFTPYATPMLPATPCYACMHHINSNNINNNTGPKNHPPTPLSPHPIIHMMFPHRTPLPDQRPQQRGSIDFGPYTPVAYNTPFVVAGFVVVVEGGEDVWEVEVGGRVGVGVFEEAGEVEDVGAGEG